MTEPVTVVQCKDGEVELLEARGVGDHVVLGDLVVLDGGRGELVFRQRRDDPGRTCPTPGPFPADGGELAGCGAGRGDRTGHRCYPVAEPDNFVGSALAQAPTGTCVVSVGDGSAT